MKMVQTHTYRTKDITFTVVDGRARRFDFNGFDITKPTLEDLQELKAYLKDLKDMVEIAEPFIKEL